MGIKTRRQILQTAPSQNLERKGPWRGIIQKCAPHERGPCAPKKSGQNHMRRLYAKKMCPCPHSSGIHAFGENFFCKLKDCDRTSFLSSHWRKSYTGIWLQRDKRTRIRRWFRGIHANDEQKKKSRREGHSKKVQNPYKCVYCKSRVRIHEEAQVFVQDFNLLITVHLLDETFAILSLGNLCEHHGYSCEWVSCRKPRKTKDGKTILCKTEEVFLSESRLVCGSLLSTFIISAGWTAPKTISSRPGLKWLRDF